MLYKDEQKEKEYVQDNMLKNIPLDYKIDAISYALNTFNPESVVSNIMTKPSFKEGFLSETALS